MTRDEASRSFDVPSDPVPQGLERRERPIAPEAFEEVGLHRSPVEGLVGLGEDVNLAPAIASLERRPPSHVEKPVESPAAREDVCEVDPVSGEQNSRVEREVGGRETETSADSLAADDPAGEDRRAPEELGRLADVSPDQESADPRATHGLAVHLRRGHRSHLEPELATARLKEGDVSPPTAAESESLSDDDVPRAKPIDEDLLGERSRRQVPDAGETSEIDPADERPKEPPAQVDRKKKGRGRSSLERGPRGRLEDVRDGLGGVLASETGHLDEDGPMPEMDAVERSDGDDGVCLHPRSLLRASVNGNTIERASMREGELSPAPQRLYNADSG
jgi:hypothetical protein